MVSSENANTWAVIEVLAKYNLLTALGDQFDYLGFSAIRFLINGETESNTMELEITHRGNMGNSLEEVEDNLKIRTGLLFTTALLDLLPNLGIQETGSFDYLWKKSYKFECGQEVDIDELESKYKEAELQRLKKIEELRKHEDD